MSYEFSLMKRMVVDLSVHYLRKNKNKKSKRHKFWKIDFLENLHPNNLLYHCLHTNELSNHFYKIVLSCPKNNFPLVFAFVWVEVLPPVNWAGQFTKPHFSSKHLTSTYAHPFARNRQLLFLNQRQERMTIGNILLSISSGPGWDQRRDLLITSRTRIRLSHLGRYLCSVSISVVSPELK